MALRLREIRQRKALSQQDLAERAGVGEATICRIEQGRVRPRPSTLRKLAAALGIAPEELTEDNKMAAG